MKQTDLISPSYRAANAAMHRAPEGFGGSGWKHADRILWFMKTLKPVRTVLDYGSGEGTLKKFLTKKHKVKQIIREYDPAIPKRSAPPSPADLVVCTDVMEHVEPDKVNNVLKHIRTLTMRGCYMCIATRPANKLMPDGSNAHRVIEDTPWWTERIAQFDWLIDEVEDKRGSNGRPHSVTFFLRVDKNP